MSFDLVLFGGTGDLAWRKLMPALFQAFRHGTLPSGGRIIGIGRDDLSAGQDRALIHRRFDKVELAKRPSEDEFAHFAALLDFVRMDLSRPDDYQRLAYAGCAAVSEPAFWGGFDRGSAAAFRDYFRQLTQYEPRPAAQYGIAHYCWLCINAKEAENVSLSREVIAIPRVHSQAERARHRRDRAQQKHPQ